MLITILKMQTFRRCHHETRGKDYPEKVNSSLVKFNWFKGLMVQLQFSIDQKMKSSLPQQLIHTSILQYLNQSIRLYFIIFSKKTIENKTSQQQQTRYIVTKTVSETSSFSHTTGASVTIGTTFEVGVPAIAMGSISVDMSLSYEYSQG